MKLIGYNLKNEELFNYLLSDKNDDELEKIENEFFGKTDLELITVTLEMESGKNVKDFGYVLETGVGRGIIKAQKFYFNI